MPTARELNDWATVAQEQIDDSDFPEIVPFDPDADDVAPDVKYGCAGHLPDFHDPERDEPQPEVD